MGLPARCHGGLRGRIRYVHYTIAVALVAVPDARKTHRSRRGPCALAVGYVDAAMFVHGCTREPAQDRRIPAGSRVPAGCRRSQDALAHERERTGTYLAPE